MKKTLRYIKKNLQSNLWIPFIYYILLIFSVIYRNKTKPSDNISFKPIIWKSQVFIRYRKFIRTNKTKIYSWGIEGESSPHHTSYANPSKGSLHPPHQSPCWSVPYYRWYSRSSSCPCVLGWWRSCYRYMSPRCPQIGSPRSTSQHGIHPCCNVQTYF